MPATTQSISPDRAPKRRKKTIEEALRWAIRDELPKRRADSPIRGPQCASDPVWRMVAMGGPVDNWSREPGMPLAMGDPHPDAIVIEAHLQVLSETLQKAATGSATCPLDLTAYPVQTELRGEASLEVLISAALYATPTWLMSCAIRGSVPDVGDGPVCGPALSDNGRVTLWHKVSREVCKGPDGEPWFVTTEERTAPTRAGQYVTGTFCKLDWTRRGAEVVEEQLRYAYCHAALVYLVPALQFLTSVEVLPPVSVPTPWLERGVEPRAPVPSLRPARDVDLTLRRPTGRRSPPTRPSPVRKIDPASWAPTGERRA